MKYLYLLLLLALISCSRNNSVDYLRYVDLMTGTGPAATTAAQKISETQRSNALTIPAITAPFGMTQWTVQIHSDETQCMAPYYFRGTISQGFRATHWVNGSCTRDYGSIGIYPTSRSKQFRYLPNQRNTMYMLNTEDLTPAYAKTLFPELGIMAQMTATERCGFFTFSWLDPQNPTIVIDINNDHGEGYIKIDTEKQEVYGYNPVRRLYSGAGEQAGIAGYFVARFDKEIAKFGTYGNNDYQDGSSECEDQEVMGAYVIFDFDAKETLKMKIGTSFTSIENARKNLNTEIAEWDFAKTRQLLENKWNEQLGRIEVESENENEMTKFYTALYHASLYPRLMSDVNGDYPAFGQQYQVNNTGGFSYYGDFYAQNTALAQMPLLSLVAPEKYIDMVKSLVAKAEDGDWLPVAPMWNSYTSAQTGDFGTGILADAAMKGFDFDLESAYSAMRKNAFALPEPDEYLNGKGRRALESYIQFGYIPLEIEMLGEPVPQAQVNRTLEYAYNDWCVAQVAEKLGESADYETLQLRSFSYSNVFDESKGWMNGRFADGAFTDDFAINKKQPFFNGHTSHLYSWFVPHDVTGLIELLGGKATFDERLDELLNSVKYDHSLTACQHLPYLYNFTGNWNKTQKAVKDVLKEQYATGAGGLSGLESAGQLSAWYVFGAMGFYPVCPGSNEYQLSSPIFEKVTLHLNKKYYPGGKLVLQTDGDAKSTVFEKIEMDGKETGPTLLHSDIQKGVKLTFSR